MGSTYQFLLITLPILFSGYALGGGDGWTPIMNLSDTKVVDIGKFAVARHNYQAKTQLAFNNLVNGQTRSGAGTEYNITIAAKDGDDDDMLKNYIAIVIDKQFQDFMHLVFFRGPV